MSDDPIELLRRLVRIPSVNPMGRLVDGSGSRDYGNIWLEGRLTAFLLERLSGGAFRIDVQEVEPELDDLRAAGQRRREQSRRQYACRERRLLHLLPSEHAFDPSCVEKVPYVELSRWVLRALLS